MKSNRLHHKYLFEANAKDILSFQERNKEFFSSRSPQQSKDYLTLEYWKKQIELAREEFHGDSSYRFIFSLVDSDEVIGFINFTQVFRKAFQACYVGYGLGERDQNKGYMTEALSFLVQFMFDKHNIHRVMANYMPDNIASEKVLHKVGFVKEGIAKKYLLINGRWEDHVLTSKSNPNWSL